MKETNNLFKKISKTDPEYRYSKETLELNFFVEMRAINVFFEKLNKKYEQEAEQIVIELKNNIDFVLVKNALKRYAETVQKLLLEPLYKNASQDIDGLIDIFENKRVEEYLAFDISEGKKTEYIFNVKRFDDYKNFLYVFVKHIECYIRFYYENLKKKYFFDFENLVEVCYKNKNIEMLNKTLIELCNKHCKSLKKYIKKFK